jgi:hypothetical protein
LEVVGLNSGWTLSVNPPFQQTKSDDLSSATMTLDHFEKALRAVWRRTPFRPFLVEMVSGDIIRVDHPEALVRRKGVAVFISSDGVPTLFDHESVSQVIADAGQKSSA